MVAEQSMQIACAQWTGLDGVRGTVCEEDLEEGDGWENATSYTIAITKEAHSKILQSYKLHSVC